MQVLSSGLQVFRKLDAPYLVVAFCILNVSWQILRQLVPQAGYFA